MEMRGIVKWFDVRKGFGFITDEEGRCLARFVSVVNEFGEEGLGTGESSGDGEAAAYGSGQNTGVPVWEGPELEGLGTEDQGTEGPGMEDGAGEPEESESEKAKGARGGRRKARAEETEKTEETA